MAEVLVGSLAAQSSPAANGLMGFSMTAAASSGARLDPSLPTLSATSNASADASAVASIVLGVALDEGASNKVEPHSLVLHQI